MKSPCLAGNPERIPHNFIVRKIFIVLVIGLVVQRSQTVRAEKRENSNEHRYLSLQTYKLPIGFERNIGQVANEIQFVARIPGYTLALTPQEAVFGFRKSAPRNPEDCRPEITICSEKIPGIFRIRLRNANTKAHPEAGRPLQSYSNYLIGNAPEKWHRHVPRFGQVRYTQVYPGVNLVFYGNGDRLEYDFIVAPHARGDVIAFSIESSSHTSFSKNAAGDLVLSVADTEVLIRKPRLYQGNSCEHAWRQNSRYTAVCRPIPGGQFSIRKRGSETFVSLELPAYNHDQALIVDPIVEFSTLLGGNVGDGADGMALDSTGNIYLIGQTNSTDFPVTPGAFRKGLAGNTDTFVTKLSPDGSQLLYSTYLGGSDAEFAHGIAVDSSGNTYLTGETYSKDFPLVKPYQSSNPSGSGFVSKLSPDGSTLVFSTYFGGTLEGTTNSIAVDANGEAIVAGRTYAVDLPVVNAFQPAHATDNGNEDAFITKFSSDGSSLLFSTYFGGTSSDMAQGVAVDGAGNIFVGGITSSSDFPTTPGSYQPTYVSSPDGSGFVAKFDGNGNLSYSTFLPACQVFAIAVNTMGNAFVTGNASIGFPVTAAAFQTVQGGGSATDAFVTEFDPTGSSLVYSTYLGGNNFDFGYAIAIDSSNNAYVTGQTRSLNFPLSGPVQATVYAGVPTAYVAGFNSTGSHLVFSTYLGGGSFGYGDSQGNAIAVDSSGDIYASGSTSAPDFPVINALQPTLHGAENAFVIKFLNQPSPEISLSSLNMSFAPTVVGVASQQQSVMLTNAGNATLLLSSIATTGDFGEANTCGSSVAPQTTCAIQVRFTPTVLGTRTGTIIIGSNATLVPETIQLSGTGQDFAIGGAPGSATVSAGQQATYSITVSPYAGFAQTISFSCTGAPQNSTCSASPTSVTLDGVHDATTNVTVVTTAHISSMAIPPGGKAPGPALVAVLGGLWSLSGASLNRNRKFRFSLFGIALLGSVVMACGGGSGIGGGGGGGGGGGIGGGTPSGKYSVVVTGTTVGGLNHGSTFSLTVN